MDDLFDISDLVVCSSSLAQCTDDYFPDGQDPEGGANETVIATSSASTKPQRFLSEGIGDMLDNRAPIGGTSKTATVKEKRARTAHKGANSRESGNEGDNNSAGLFADLVDETMDEGSWMD